MIVLYGTSQICLTAALRAEPEDKMVLVGGTIFLCTFAALRAFFLAKPQKEEN
jgi:hypothetical protein